MSVLGLLRGGACVPGTARMYRPLSTAPETVKSALNAPEEDEEFRVLELYKKRTRPPRRMSRRGDVPPDRAHRMPPDQDWGNVWPGPRSFHPSTVPLPLHQGWVPLGQAPPGKKANAELMKIPNFLHLTPPVIRRQCEALKQFCTAWPAELDSEAAVERHYPLEVVTSDYCHASPSIRNPLARVVSLRVKLSSLELSRRARDKFLRLVGDRHDENTDLVTITADRCPLRRQNLDYATYLLTALYHESFQVEQWEQEKTEDDMECYDFDRNQSRKSLIDWYMRSSGRFKELSAEEYKDFDVASIRGGERLREAVVSLKNAGETGEAVREYGAAVRAVLGLPAEKV